MTDDERMIARICSHSVVLARQVEDRLNALIADRDGVMSTLQGAFVDIAAARDGRDKAEAEVARLRGLLRRAGVALWDTGVDHPVLQDIDDALPPGWVAQARKDKP